MMHCTACIAMIHLKTELDGKFKKNKKLFVIVHCPIRPLCKAPLHGLLNMLTCKYFHYNSWTCCNISLYANISTVVVDKVCEQFKIQSHIIQQRDTSHKQYDTHLSFSTFPSTFCRPAGDQVLAGHGRKSVHGAAENGERKHNGGSESPARAAEHFSLQSQNSKTSTVLFQCCFWLYVLITLNLVEILNCISEAWWRVVSPI